MLELEPREEINQAEADARWKKRVEIRAMAGKIADLKAWFGTDSGQMTLIAAFVLLMVLAGAAEKINF